MIPFNEAATIRALIQILIGTEETAVSVDITDPCLWRLARENHLLLALGEHVLKVRSEQTIPSPYRARFRALRARQSYTGALIAELLSAFEAAHLPVLTIKSFLPFPYADSNVDLVTVEPHRWDAYVQCLQSLGFRRWRSLADWREPGKKMYRRHVDGAGERLHPYVHLHRGISWNGVDYLDLQAVVVRKQLLDQSGVLIPVPSAMDELLIMAAHAYFENKLISLHELLYFYHLCPKIMDWSELERVSMMYHWRHAWESFLIRVTALAKQSGLPLPVTLTEDTKTFPLQMPFLLPIAHTFEISWRKLWLDIWNGRLRQVPRQLFTYTFVDGVWMYRKAYRKRRVVEKC